VLALAACRSWPDPPPELARSLRARAEGERASFRGRATVSVDSRGLRGEFDALVAARAGPPARVRLQLWPDLGAKILDFEASPTRIRGAFAGMDPVNASPATAPRHPVVFFALTLLEIASPLTPERIRGVRWDAVEGIWEARVDPVAADYDLRVWLDPSGRVVRRRYRFRRAAWTDVPGEVHRVEAKAFALAIRDIEIVRDAEIPDHVFEASTP
jgi:hypothetical protein